MFAKALSLVLLVFLTKQCEGKIYDRCELANTLFNEGITPGDISTWVCIAQRESHYNTTAINTVSGDYGIFQISSLFWCDQGSAGCGIACEDLLGDDITIDISCIKKIYAEWVQTHGNGFMAWTSYEPYCSIDTYPYIAGCP